MLTVYIADDEEIVRQGLKRIIDWDDLGFEICGEAGNGLSAYNDIRELNPDLILLDIRMPKLQGLDLASQLREKGYSGRIIILSGYSEFKYAQEAIKYDVDFYLTKPIDEDELKKAVVEIRHILQKKKLHTEHMSYYQEKAKHKIIEDMLKVEGKSLATIEYSLGELNLKANLYQILIVQPIKEGFDAFFDLCEELKIPAKSNTIEKLKVEQYEVILLKGEFIIGRFYAFKDRHTDITGKPYFIASGAAVTGINDIYYSYHEALSVHERRFFFEEKKFIASKDDLPMSDSLRELFTTEKSRALGQELYGLIEIYKLKESKEMLYDLSQRLVYAQNSAESIKSFLAGMYLYMIQEYKRDYAGKLEFWTNADIINWVHECMFLSDILDFIDGEIDRMIQAISSFSSDSIVDEILEYIKHHYSEDIKLKTLAPKFGYNSSYLGKIFTKKLGVSFNDCLHKIRTDKAKELLLNERYKVYEVSDMVGYKNVDYFHLKFKLFIGSTPNEFRIANHIKAE